MLWDGRDMIRQGTDCCTCTLHTSLTVIVVPRPISRPWPIGIPTPPPTTPHHFFSVSNLLLWISPIRTYPQLDIFPWKKQSPPLLLPYSSKHKSTQLFNTGPSLATHNSCSNSAWHLLPCDTSLMLVANTCIYLHLGGIQTQSPADNYLEIW